MNNPQIHHFHQRNTQQTIRKYTTPTNETRNEHPVRRRGRFIAPVSLHYKIRAFVPSYIHFRTTFRGYIRICGHDKSAPTAAYKMPKYCEQIGITQHSRNETHNEQSANIPHSPTKHATNNPQIHHSHQRNSQRTPQQA